MTQLGDIIDTRVTFYIEYSRKGADDWYSDGTEADTIERALRSRDGLAQGYANTGHDIRIVRETTVTEVVKA